MLKINENLSIRLAEFKFSYARSPGPGGQHVNKVNSKVIMKWSVERNKSLPHDVKQRLTEKFKNRIANSGELIVTSHRFRDQGRNVADCLNKLREMVLVVATAPRKRKPTRVPQGVNRRRLENKRRKSQTKQDRKRPNADDN